jgi:hypothetical protein
LREVLPSPVYEGLSFGGDILTKRTSAARNFVGPSTYARRGGNRASSERVVVDYAVITNKIAIGDHA